METRGVWKDLPAAHTKEERAMQKRATFNNVVTHDYEAPRLEPASAARGPQGRGTLPGQSVNFVCGICTDSD